MSLDVTYNNLRLARFLQTLRFEAWTEICLYLIFIAILESQFEFTLN
jgi:hypothetical protein